VNHRPMVRVLDANYIGSGTRAEHLPGPALPEVAFVGRSNVGKSSLLNTLTGRRGLARTSKTPGHTQKINLFEVRADDDGRELRVIFADLPGYGFAHRSKEERKAWQPMIEGYLLQRPSLRLMCLLVDVRRGIEPDDVELVEFWAQTKKPLVLVGTKLDKLPKAQHKPALAKLQAAARGIVQLRVVGFSAETGYGEDQLWNALARIIAPRDA
jgi:GTP-binding protein